MSIHQRSTSGPMDPWKLCSGTALVPSHYLWITCDKLERLYAFNSSHYDDKADSVGNESSQSRNRLNSNFAYPIDERGETLECVRWIIATSLAPPPVDKVRTFLSVLHDSDTTLALWTGCKRQRTTASHAVQAYSIVCLDFLIAQYSG